MITGLSVLGILFRREYIVENGILFGEDYTYYGDLPFIVQAMCGTERVFEVRKILYHKRYHNDPINMPALSQITDEKTRLMEIMRAYHDCGFDGYIRPDHGRHLWNEGPGTVRPGYGLYDRALGIMYMLGVWDMLDKLEA